MNNSRRVTLIVAVVLALGTGILTLRYLTSLQQAAPPPAETRQVIVAVKDIPARAKITVDMLRLTTRPAAEVDPDTISDPKQAVDSLALITIPAGSTLTTSKIGRPAELAMPVRLQAGMRALTLSGDRVKAVSGFVQPGDRVDIIAIPPRQGSGPPAGVTILRGILVLAINSTMEQMSAQTQQQQQQNDTGNPATITVAVTPKEADLLAAVDQEIPLRLALRSPQEPLHSLPNESLVLPNTDHAAAAPPPPPAPPMMPPPDEGARPAPQAPIAQEGGVMVIDGDKVVTGR